MPVVTSYSQTEIGPTVTDFRRIPFSRQTTDYVLELDDDRKCIEMYDAVDHYVTVPPDADVPFINGTVIDVIQRDVGTVIIVPGSGVTLLSLTGTLNSAGQFAHIRLHKVDVDEWYVYGDLLPP